MLFYFDIKYKKRLNKASLKILILLLIKKEADKKIKNRLCEFDPPPPFTGWK